MRRKLVSLYYKFCRVEACTLRTLPQQSTVVNHFVPDVPDFGLKLNLLIESTTYSKPAAWVRPSATLASTTAY